MVLAEVGSGSVDIGGILRKERSGLGVTGARERMGKKISIHQKHKFRGRILPGVSRRTLKITQEEVDEAVRVFLESGGEIRRDEVVGPNPEKRAIPAVWFDGDGADGDLTGM